MKNESAIAAVCIIEDKDGDILFLARSKSPLGLGLPGGKVDEQDEGNLLNTIVREVYEETAIDISNEDIIFVDMAMSFNDRKVGVFKVKIQDKPNVILSKEHKFYTWININNIANTEEYMAGNTNKFLAYNNG